MRHVDGCLDRWTPAMLLETSRARKTDNRGDVHTLVSERVLPLASVANGLRVRSAALTQASVQ
jgi:hypothetical protein